VRDALSPIATLAVVIKRWESDCNLVSYLLPRIDPFIPIGVVGRRVVPEESPRAI